MTLAAIALCFTSHAAIAGQNPPASPTRTDTVRVRRLKRSGASFEVLTPVAFRAQTSGDPHIPKNLADLRSFLQRMRAAAPGLDNECGEREMGRLSAALQNPDLADSDLDGVDASFSESKPTLSKSFVKGHFKIKYTDIHAEARHNTTEAKVKVLADVLNDAWDDYAVNFKEPSHYLDGEGKEWIDIEIYDLPGSPAARTQSSWRRIEIDKALVMDHPAKIYTIPVHELFHRVQYAYGVRSGTAGDEWAVEGTAAWAQKYRAGSIGDYLERIGQGLANPDRALTARSYDACSFWVYLGERANDEKAPIKGLWSRYSSNGRNLGKALEDTLRATFGAPYGLGQFGNEWAFTNFIKDLTGKPAYFDYAEDETATGWGYGPLGSVLQSSKSVSKGGAASTVSGAASAYGADYTVYRLLGKPTKVDLTVTASAAAVFSYNFVFYKGTAVATYLRTPSGGNGNYSRTVTIDPNQVDRVAAIIVGNPIGGAYTLKVRAR